MNCNILFVWDSLNYTESGINSLIEKTFGQPCFFPGNFLSKRSMYVFYFEVRAYTLEFGFYYVKHSYMKGNLQHLLYILEHCLVFFCSEGESVSCI